MKLTAALQRLRQFEDEIAEEFRNRPFELPLQDLCVSGGVPSTSADIDVYDLKILERAGAVWIGVCMVTFVEENRTGCRDKTWTDPRKGEISFTIQLETGEVSFNPPIRREYEKEEF